MNTLLLLLLLLVLLPLRYGALCWPTALGTYVTDLVSLQLQPHVVLGSPEAAASLPGWHTLS
jgi:hypothetical protein